MSIHERDTSLESLKPAARAKVEKLMLLIDKLQLPMELRETYRSQARQDYLYSKGRTDESKAKGESIVTKTSRSRHTKRKAADFVINTKHGTLKKKGIVVTSPWETGHHKGKVTDPGILMIWLTFGALAKQCGLEWGGDWRKGDDLLGWDPYHVED